PRGGWGWGSGPPACHPRGVWSSRRRSTRRGGGRPRRRGPARRASCRGPRPAHGTPVAGVPLGLVEPRVAVVVVDRVVEPRAHRCGAEVGGAGLHGPGATLRR